MRVLPAGRPELLALCIACLQIQAAVGKSLLAKTYGASQYSNT